jgi:hypothetical protein
MMHADRPVSLNGGKQNVTKMSKGFRCCGQLRAGRPRVRGFIPGKANEFLFYISLTLHLGIILVNNQFDALFQCIYLFHFGY